MGKLFGLVLMLIALYIGMTIYTKGLDHVVGGAFDPIEPSGRETPLATHLTPGAQMADAPTERKRRTWITDSVRERVTEDLEQGARRRGF